MPARRCRSAIRSGQPSQGQYGEPSRRRALCRCPVRCVRAVRHRPAVRRWPAERRRRRAGERRPARYDDQGYAAPGREEQVPPGLEFAGRFGNRGYSLYGEAAEYGDAAEGGSAEQAQTAGYGAASGQFAEAVTALPAPVAADAASGEHWSPNGAQARQGTGAYPAYGTGQPQPGTTGPAYGHAEQSAYQQQRLHATADLPAARVPAAARLPGGAAARLPAGSAGEQTSGHGTGPMNAYPAATGGQPVAFPPTNAPETNGYAANGHEGNGYDGNGYAPNRPAATASGRTAARATATTATATPQTAPRPTATPATATRPAVRPGRVPSPAPGTPPAGPAPSRSTARTRTVTA